MQEIERIWDELIIRKKIVWELKDMWTWKVIWKRDEIVWVIEWDDFWFACLIDMSYKWKEDQISEMFYKFSWIKSEFETLCQKLDIGLYEYPVCSKCWKIIYWSHSWWDWPVCFGCEKKIW